MCKQIEKQASSVEWSHSKGAKLFFAFSLPFLCFLPVFWTQSLMHEGYFCFFFTLIPFERPTQSKEPALTFNQKKERQEWKKEREKRENERQNERRRAEVRQTDRQRERERESWFTAKTKFARSERKASAVVYPTNNFFQRSFFLLSRHSTLLFATKFNQT